MLINKMQTKDDVKDFGNVSEEKLTTILKNTPEYLINIIADIFMAFQLKAEVPLDIAETNVRRLREKNVARLFENADFGDLGELVEKQWQLMRQRQQLMEANTQLEEQQSQLMEANAQLEEQQSQLMEASAQLEEQQSQLEEAKNQRNKSIRTFIEVMQESGVQKSRVHELLITKQEFGEKEAVQYLNMYWRM